MGWWSLFPDPHLALSLFLSSLALILALGIAAFFLEYVRKIGCKHSLERTAALDAFFEDPNSLKKVPCPSIFDPAEKYLSLIVPAYNEEHRLPGALIETINYLQQRSAVEKSFSYEGMLHSRGELLLMLDADGATKVTDLEKLETQIRALAKKDKDNLSAAMPNGLSLKLSDIEVAAFGSRAHLEKQALATRKWYRNLLMKGFHLVVLLTAGPGIRDTQCGFKMFTRAAARKLFTNIRLKRWCFDVELVYLCKHLGIPMIEVSVTWSEIPGSKVRMTSIMHMLFELILIRLGYGLGIWKIYT
ncbi:dolichyl-phosphate beta-glucosyltransferase-like isoform X2 [Phoenix dactylifera]|uniref:Dolichyl-phosphate beta-glucosyltransferase-like isoform X2 n=1 Tax=Phoenix dactylifera TaxID=42345 RepID=A0A8B7CNC5_PHODC|nr:dolichyl-phosphate beta-glucosyltransferase-like isoform X2 [Phoenix dactylifera]